MAARNNDEKDKRDLLIYWIWQSGRLTNAQIGNLFGLTHSAVSHNVTGIKKKMRTDKGLRTLIRKLDSQFTL
jgi:chromosomal replication initiation ATPase DnaA